MAQCDAPIPWLDADHLGVPDNLPNVGHSETVEQVHQDHNHCQHKDEEEDVGDNGESLAGVDGDVREVELPDKHGKCPDDSCPGAVKEIQFVVVILLDIIVQVLQKGLDMYV